MAEKGIDWGQEENKGAVEAWCKKFKLSFEQVEPQLRKHYQSKLEDFKDES